MVDNPENILVEFDYNNITIIDPNKVIDENGRAKERLVKQEDLVMYANLECKVLPRTKLAVGTANNDAIQTVSIATINFLKPGNKEYLDNSWTDEMTGKDSLTGEGVNQPKLNSIKNPNRPNDYFIRQTINSGGKPGTTDTGLLGITSINIRQNTSFMPTVTIKLIDIKGRALFESGDNSPYASFFNLPYPMFQLTIKGFYGKAVRLPLMLQNFTSSYSYATGNFEITLTYYTYKYTLLSEVTMGALLATPQMYRNNLSIEPKKGTSSQYVKVTDIPIEKGYQKVKEVYSEYKTKGLIPDEFPELTITQMKYNIENFLKNIFDSFSKQPMDSLRNVGEYQETLNNYEKDIYTALNGSWFNNYMDVNNFFVLKKDKTKIYTFKSELDPEKKQNAINELIADLTKYNNLLNNNETVGEKGTFKINGKSEDSKIKCNVTYEDFYVKLGNFNDEIDWEESYILRKKTKIIPDSAQVNEFKKELTVSNLFNSSEVILKDGNTPVKYSWFKFEDGNTGSKIGGKETDFVKNILEPKGSFVNKLDQIGKNLKINREKIEIALTDALSSLLQSKDSGIGFVPNIRNVLAVIFANGEGFLRLMDDVHTVAWNVRDDEDRKKAIYNTQVAGASSDNLVSGVNGTIPVYPWPQFVVENGGDNQEKYTIKYPGDYAFQSKIKSYLPSKWPEVEFVEEFIKGMIQRSSPAPNPTPTTNALLDINRISLNAIEFPIGNYVFSNKEEIKYFFEIYERLLLITTTSKLSRVINNTKYTENIVDLIAESESKNMIQSLSNTDPYLIKKLTEYGLNSGNFLATLRHFSNEGLGQSWQNYIRGIYNTPYIKNVVSNGGFEFINEGILNSSTSQPLVALIHEPKMVEYITGSSTSNEFDFTDTYPFTNKSWDNDYLANSASASNANQYFNTGKVLTFNESKKIITNFLDTNSSDEKRPITNFNFKKVSYPTDYSSSITNVTLKSFYENRLIENQLPTEGNVNYYNYNNQLTAKQTTSIFNTPYFINSIQEGVQNFRDYSKYPFVSAAYYFINSLPLATLREKYKTYNGTSTTDLDYIFATLKKYGAIHKLPYAWILKIGSVWHRYKTYVETNVDILDKSWSGFSYTNNFDPITNNNAKTYNLVINSSQIDIVLQQTAFIGLEESTLINTGFYPKLINDFNVFYQGFQVYSGYTSGAIQDGFNSGITMNYVANAIINYPEGFDPLKLKRDLRIIPWSVTMDTLDGKFQYVMPSQGSLINQTKNECFNINASPINQLKVEVVNNQGMYNGSVRLFWASPNYGYFNSDLVYKPSPTEYMKKVLSGSSIQENFSFNDIGEYTKISEIFSVFEKDVLDKFEGIFLNFSKSVYDIDNSNPAEDPLLSTLSGVDSQSNSDTTYKNFQSLIRDMMKVVKEKSNGGEDFVTKVQNAQLLSITQKIGGFLNYNVVFKYGNPSNFDRRLFQSFSDFEITDPYTWEKYTISTPNALPTSGNSTTLTQSVNLYPNEWKSLRTYVGFSEMSKLSYSSNGSYITDFFVDLNIAFNITNIKNFVPIIKIYATQKLNENTLNSEKFFKLMTDYLTLNQNFQDKIINNLMIKLQNNLPKTTITSDGSIKGENNLKQTKSELYQMFKALNDKWIAGNDFKTKTLFEDVLLMDRASRDVGDKILVDIFKLKDRLTDINTDSSMLIFVQTILVENHFVVMNLPSYINFYNVQEAVKNPIPRAEGSTEFANTMFGTFLNVDYRDSSAKMVCFYGGKPSEQLDLKNNVDYRYRSDAFDLRRASDNPLIEDQIGKKDWDKSNKVVGFNVDIGPQNQQIFVGFDVRQNAGQATAESLEILNQMANLEGGRGGSTQNTSLYNLYKNRSYTCQVTMMGNALIQPTMYFNLRYVPMFSGPYMILEVNHTISPGSFMTYITGIRQPTASLPKIDDYIQSLRTNLLQSLIDKNEADKRAKDGTTNINDGTVIGQKNNVQNDLTSHPANTSSSSIGSDCKPADGYSSYVGVIPNKDKTTSSVIDMVNTIVSKTNNVSISNIGTLQYTIFSAMYLSSYIYSNFTTYEYNFAGIKLDKKWGGSLDSFFYKKQYYCSKNNIPYAYFENLGESVEFMVTRWKLRMGKVELTKESITKFLILNSGAISLDDNVYNTYNKTELSNLESKVQNAINELNSVREQ